MAYAKETSANEEYVRRIGSCSENFVDLLNVKHHSHHDISLNLTSYNSLVCMFFFSFSSFECAYIET